MRIDLLEQLCQAVALPGAEEKLQKIIVKHLKNYTSDITIDCMGNIIAHIKGKGPKVVLDAHMDEVGFMVHYIDPNGFLKLTPLGGMDPRIFYAQRVMVHGKKDLIGVVASIPPHISKNGNNQEVPEVEDCVVDLGLSAEKVHKLVKVGDLVSFCYSFEKTEDAVVAKALDDRVGLFVFLEALKKAKKINCDLYVTATVQEEVGLRGARLITPVVEPDYVVALEGTVSMNIPGIPEDKMLAKALEGPEIRLSDRFLVADRKFSFFIMELAEKNKIPYQVTVKKAGSTNATAMQVTGKGSKAAVVSVPTRYLHSPSSLAFKDDISNTIQLIALLLENINKFKNN
ncbi:MAG TPA: M42 family peptidase [Thermodesulfobacteriota bacterium]|nr:M42 family peptidase [Thermodesulfobacteriota bacterium]